MSRELWIEAGTILAADPATAVKCPDCGEANLDVSDTKVGTVHVERTMSCPKCGSHNALLKRTSET